MRVPLAGLPLKRRAALVLSGALGFGLGGAIAGAAGDFLLLAFAALGACGAYALSWARPERRVRLVLAGALGFFAGLTFCFFIVLAVWEPPAYSLALIGALGGAVGGLTLGLAWGDGWRPVGLFALAGGAGFGAGFALVELARDTAAIRQAVAMQEVYGALVFAAAGVVGGAAMGLAAAFAEPRG